MRRAICWPAAYADSPLARRRRPGQRIGRRNRRAGSAASPARTRSATPSRTAATDCRRCRPGWCSPTRWSSRRTARSCSPTKTIASAGSLRAPMAWSTAGPTRSSGPSPASSARTGAAPRLTRPPTTRNFRGLVEDPLSPGSFIVSSHGGHPLLRFGIAPTGEQPPPPPGPAVIDVTETIMVDDGIDVLPSAMHRGHRDHRVDDGIDGPAVGDASS